MKNKQRLDHELLADALRARGMVSPSTLEHVLHQCHQTGAMLCEQLVRDGVVSDWELAQLCSETFGLPFMPVDLYEPDLTLLQLFDPGHLRQYGLVPLERFGKVLVIAMPCMVPSEILHSIQDRLGVKVMPIVGSVRANVRFLEENLTAAPLIADMPVDADSWAGVLDLGDAAVQVELVSAEAEAALDQVESGLSRVLDESSFADVDSGRYSNDPGDTLELLDLDEPDPPLPNDRKNSADVPRFDFEE